MPTSDADSLFLVLTLVVGGAMFLRIVAREKHRRERWLQFRLEEKIKELQENPSGVEDVEIVVARPADVGT